MANTIVANRRKVEQIRTRLSTLRNEVLQTTSSLRPTALDRSTGAGADALAEMSASVAGLGHALALCVGSCESILVEALGALEEADAEAAGSMR